MFRFHFYLLINTDKAKFATQGGFYMFYLLPHMSTCPKDSHIKRKTLSNIGVTFCTIVLHHVLCITCLTTFCLLIHAYNFVAPSILSSTLLNLQLGLVIDLTNTTRYYPLSDWTKEGIGHVKVAYDILCYCF